MPARTLDCELCSRPLEPAQQLRFHVETASLAEPGFLAAVRRLPVFLGRPMCVCGRCQARIESRPRAAGRRPLRSAVVTAIGGLVFGWAFAAVLRD